MDERKAFEAWRRTPLQALAMTYGPKPHPDVEELAWRAWQAATLAARERVTAAEQASRYEADLCQQALERVKVLEDAMRSVANELDAEPSFASIGNARNIARFALEVKHD